MEMESEVEIIFEAWLFKLHGSPHERSTFQFKSPWKRRYFILVRKGNLAHLQYYEKKPRTLNDSPKGVIVFDKSYLIEKCGKVRGKEYTCTLNVAGDSLTLATEDEKILHLFLFFVHTQTRLLTKLEGECFVVRPETSDEMRRLGARGNMCLLHVSKWGVTLALQLSKCVLCQWPLSCIKSYETRGRGQFCFETGMRSLTGAGQYIFNMRTGQENNVYDTVDNFVNEVAGLRQMVSARSSDMEYGTLESVEYQLEALGELTEPCSDATYIPQLKRISRDIYDHLAEHLGASTSTRLDSTPASPVNSDYMQNRLNRSDNINIKSSQSGGMSTEVHSAGAIGGTSASASSSLQKEVISSQYLHTSLPLNPSLPASKNSLSPTKPPQMGRNEAKEDTMLKDAFVDKPNNSRSPLSVEFAGLRPRLRSCSFDDLNDYARMSMHLHKKAEAVSYQNDAFVDQAYCDVKEGDMYSYAKSPGNNSTNSYFLAKPLSASAMRKSISNPDLLENTPPLETPHLAPLHMPATTSDLGPSSGYKTSSDGPSECSTLPKKDQTKPLIKGFSISSGSRVFTRTRNQQSPLSPDIPMSLLRHQDSISKMHGRRLPSLPPQEHHATMIAPALHRGDPPALLSEHQTPRRQSGAEAHHGVVRISGNNGAAGGVEQLSTDLHGMEAATLC